MSTNEIYNCQMQLEIQIDYIYEEVALEREVEGDLFLQDIGQGFGFRPGSFDGAIRSVWLVQRS